VTDEWYRSSEWSEQARVEFERRLRRARPHKRPQYLRIKAISLREHGGEAGRRGARELNERVLSDYPNSAFDVAVCLAELATLAEREGATDEAIEHLRAATHLADEGMVRGDEHLRLAELLIRSDDPERWREAGAVLDQIIDSDLAFSSERFRCAVLRARIAAREGDEATAANSAKTALAETTRSKPDFSRHPDLGWASADPATLAEMHELADP
jgi:hypothetical protein